MRRLLAAASLSLAWLSHLALGADDLSRFFAGRNGSALLWDLEKDALAGVWNEAAARGTELRPGSLLKPFTMAALLEQGLYQPDWRVRCKEGDLAGEAALAYSCNEYFDEAAKRADLQRGYARFGLDAGRPTLRLMNLLDAYRRLVARHREARLAPVFAGLRQAVDYGTAQHAKTPEFTVAGKTGTMRETALFAGFAPAAKPRYLLLIHLGSGTGGGDAAPYAGKIFRSLFAVAKPPTEPGTVSVRLFWNSKLNGLNLRPGQYPAGAEIRLGASVLAAPGEITVTPGAITAQVALEDYVLAVLHGEAGGFRQAASREAMAVAARTYAAHFRGRHSDEGFDFCDTTHCQDARFVRKVREDLKKAVEATDGELLWYQGAAAAAYYHADSGGRLEGMAGHPYLRTRPDPWWKDEDRASWSWRVRSDSLAEALHLTLIRPGVQILAREPSGRVKALSVFGHAAEGVAFRMAVGRLLGWEKLPSRLFDVKTEEKEIVFSGKGRGHGWGMPQTSAERMAAAGKTYREILAEYYPGTQAGVTARGFSWRKLSEDKLTLFTTDEQKDGPRLAAAAKLWRGLESELELSGQATLRIYPTRESFRNATGITAPVQGVARGTFVYLISGFSTNTLRHELLHALLEQNTRTKHPEWFREGLVQALNEEQSAEALKVRGLLRRVGRERVLAWWRSGLPREESGLPADKIQ